MKLLVFLVASLFFTGCTTIGERYSPPPKPPQGTALVHVMRTSVGYGNFSPTAFSVNDITVVSLYDKGYSWLYLSPGVYKFSAGILFNSDYLKFTMSIEPDKEYFIQYTQERAGFGQLRNVIRAVNVEQGKKLIQKHSYKEADKVEIPITLNK